MVDDFYFIAFTFTLLDVSPDNYGSQLDFEPIPSMFDICSASKSVRFVKAGMVK